MNFFVRSVVEREEGIDVRGRYKFVIGENLRFLIEWVKGSFRRVEG